MTSKKVEARKEAGGKAKVTSEKVAAGRKKTVKITGK